jgi:hypothetical protein
MASGHPRGIQAQVDRATIRLRHKDGWKPSTGTERDILETIKKHIRDAKAVNFLRSGDIEVTLNTTATRDRILRGPDPGVWRILRNGYAAEIPFVALKTMPNAVNEEARKQIVQQTLEKLQDENQWKGRELLDARWLQDITPAKKDQAASTPPRRLHGTLIVTAATPVIRDRIVRSGIIIGGRMHTAHLFDFGAIIRQCFNCQEWGHTQRGCGKDPKCGKCAERHQTQQCKSEKPRCVNCGKRHAAWRRVECIGFRLYLKRVQMIRAEARATSARIRSAPASAPKSTSTSPAATEAGWEVQGSRKRRRNATPLGSPIKRGVGRPRAADTVLKDPKQGHIMDFVATLATKWNGTGEEPTQPR